MVDNAGMQKKRATGAPCYFIHGTQWAHIPSTLSIGLSCRADDATKRKPDSLHMLARTYPAIAESSPACALTP
eukprot:7854434-Pyramimonas_sp.AAC.1